MMYTLGLVTSFIRGIKKRSDAMGITITKAKTCPLSAFDRKYFLHQTQLFHFHLCNRVLKEVCSYQSIKEYGKKFQTVFEIDMNNHTEEEDYIDKLSGVLPWHRSFTSLERLLVVLIVSTFVSIVGCTLLCLICSRSPLRRRYYSKKKLSKL
jgi:glutaredoxin